MANGKIQASEVMPFLLIGGALVFGTTIWNKLFGKSQQSGDAQNTQQTVTATLQQLAQSGVKPSYNDAQFKLWADAMYDAMFDIGTNEQTIYNVMGYMKNNADIVKQVEQFGVRTYYTFGFPQGDYNLGQWFNQELSDSEKAKVNSILKAKGITYSFA